MRKLPDFSNEDAVEAWFKTQPPEVAIAIAARASLRLLPTVMGNFAPNANADKVLGMRLAVFRATLVSAARAMCPADQIQQAKRLQDAARAAARAARFVYTDDSAGAAARAFRSATAAERAAKAEAAAAISFVLSRGSAGAAATPSASATDAARAGDDLPAVFDAALWPDESEAPELAQGWASFRDTYEQDPVWGFWVKWYAAMWHGTPLDWALQTQIALIDNAIWEQGPEAVADKIREIEARSVANMLAERIDVTPAGRLTLVPQPFSSSPTVGLLLQTLEDALDDGTREGQNYLTEQSYQVVLLRRTLTRYGNDPQRIEMDVERARTSLLKDIAEDILPATTGNQDLVQVLEDIGGTLRLDDPEIARNRERLNKVRLGRISEDVGRQIAKVAVDVAAISDGLLQEDLLEDQYHLPGVTQETAELDPIISLGAAERNSVLEAQAAQLRLASRLTRVWLYLKANKAQIIMNGVSVLGGLASIIGLLLVFVG
ncbi:MAG: hypothetical protein JJ894_03990 [Dinoroseobacter sp.]|nr:hypothetical protein [Dinoroseobacter sp.]